MITVDPNKPPQSNDDWRHLIWGVIDAFSPGAPIDELDLLAGRKAQIDQMIDTVMQRGQHCILYGERGTGKSSLANTFSTRLVSGIRSLSCVPINCHPSDDFTRVWRKVFRRLSSDNGSNLSDRYPKEIQPDDVVVELSGFPLNTIPIIILDEFDKLGDNDARTLIARAYARASGQSRFSVQNRNA